MGAGAALEYHPCAKGPIPYCLDECSKGRGARGRLKRLHEALMSIAPEFRGIETVFETHLLSRIFKDGQTRSEITRRLRMNWFDDSSKEAYFRNQRVAAIYAQGVVKALELSLKGKPRPIPINGWWVLDFAEVKMLTLADVDDKGVTVGGEVTLLILTPRPRDKGTLTTPILGSVAQAWVSEQTKDREVITRRIETSP